MWHGNTHGSSMADLGLIVLAGGAARRMGGVNKALMPFRGQPLIAHVLANLASAASAVVISANRDLDALVAYGYPVAPDNADCCYGGPLAGIVSAAARLPENIDCIQVVPCDMPFLPAQVMTALQHTLAVHDADIVYATCGEQRYPIVCQLRRRHVAEIAAVLHRDGKHSVRSVIEPYPHLAVPFSQTAWFANCNDLAALQQLAATGVL